MYNYFYELRNKKMEVAMEDITLEFFKTFADSTRIKIAAALIDETLTVEQIAQRVNLRPVDVPRQLTRLEQLGLLINENRTYRFDVKALEKLSRETLAGLRPQVAETSNDENADEFDRKVVKNYSLPDGRLREIPLQNRKFSAILRHVVTVFEPGKRYTEKEINEALKRFHEDSATLRRGLVDSQMLDRENNGAVYWINENQS
jgi:hypothetical protein